MASGQTVCSDCDPRMEWNQLPIKAEAIAEALKLSWRILLYIIFKDLFIYSNSVSRQEHCEFVGT